MVEVEDSKSVAEMEDLGTPIYILGQEGEVAPWLEKGNDQTPRDIPPLDGTSNVPAFGTEAEGLAPATVRGERLPCTKFPQAVLPARQHDCIINRFKLIRNFFFMFGRTIQKVQTLLLPQQ